VLSVVSTGQVAQTAGVPLGVMLLGAVGIVIGLATYGKRVMATVGSGITALTPSRGLSAELAAATTIVVASGTGMPVSTTHTLVGAVLGVGMARGIAAIDLRIVGQIFSSWLITLPAGAALAILFFWMLRLIFG
jgi:PiT family inorganic phosphate transporter